MTIPSSHIFLGVVNYEVSIDTPRDRQTITDSPKEQTAIPPSAILHPPLPATNLYFMAIMRIHDVKRGPFFEHSSQLYNIATGVPNWGKVNSGLFKMYRVRGRFTGGLLSFQRF